MNKGQIALGIAGTVALMVCVMYLSNLRMQMDDDQRKQGMTHAQEIDALLQRMLDKTSHLHNGTTPVVPAPVVDDGEIPQPPPPVPELGAIPAPASGSAPPAEPCKECPPPVKETCDQPHEHDEGVLTHAPGMHNPFRAYKTPALAKIFEAYTARFSAPTPPADAKYAVFLQEPGNPGLGNTLLGLASVFLYALLTNRGLLINWPQGGMLKPPTGMDWNFLAVPDQASSSRVEIHVDQNPDNVRAHYETMMCSDFDTQTEKYVILCSNQHFLPLITHNPKYQDILKSWFGDSLSHVYGPLARFLFKPNDAIQKQVDDYKASHFGDFNVGMQIRRTDNAPIGLRGVDVFQKCALNIADQYRDEVTAAGDNRDEKEVKFYVASDDEGTRKMMKSKYGDMVMEYSTGADGTISKWKGDGPLIDVYLLAQCDEIIISSGSTFGYIAHGWASMTPYVVTNFHSCVKLLSSEPCFHGWDRLMGNNSGLHVSVSCFSAEEQASDMVNHHHCWL